MPTDFMRFDGAALERSIQHVRVLRLAFGTTGCLLVSQMVGWQFSYIAPLITLFVLSLPSPSPGLGGGLKLVIALSLGTYSGVLLLPLLLYQTLAGLVLLALAMFWAFYAAARGAPAAIASLVSLGLTLVVAVGSVSVDAYLEIAAHVARNALIGVGFALLGHTLFKDPALPAGAGAADAATDLPAEPGRSALRSLLIVLPVAVWLLFSSASAANVGFMIKVTSMGQQASLGAARVVARSLIISTFAGGVAAVVLWEILRIWPSLVLYTLLVALAGLVFGRRVFSGVGLRPDGATWSYAYLTMLLILAPAALDGVNGDPAGAKFFDRLWMFVGATVYGVGAVFVFDLLGRRRMDKGMDSGSPGR